MKDEESEPDFIGYIFSKDNNSTVVVGTQDNEPPDVLITKGNKLEVGSKVEVRNKEDGVADTFPHNAPSTLSEIKVSSEEKETLKLLLEDMYKKQGNNFYPVILKVEEKTNEWVIKTKEYYLKLEGETYKTATYSISKADSNITVTYD